MIPKHKPYKNLTGNEKKRYCNGCGGKGGLINPPEFLFHASCNHHDYLYYCGGTEIHRLKADRSFLRFMLLDADNASNLALRRFYRFWAFTYYFAVRYRGKKYFNYETI